MDGRRDGPGQAFVLGGVLWGSFVCRLLGVWGGGGRGLKVGGGGGGGRMNEVSG